MPLDTLAVNYAFWAGTASFFSPCSTGLLPAYMGYYVSAEQAADGRRAFGASLRTGLGMGLAASAGFFALLVVLAGVVILLPFRWLGPALPYVSLGIGAAIVVLGVLLLMGRGLPLRLSGARLERTWASVFLFGLLYALASVGCTFPLFLSVVLGGAATGSAASGATALLVYGLGMSMVMVAVTVGLALSKDGAARFLRRATPVVTRVAAGLMVVAGSYVIYYWIDLLRDVGRI